MNARLKKEIKNFIKQLRFRVIVDFKIYHQSRISLNVFVNVALLSDKDINENNNDKRNKKKK